MKIHHLNCATMCPPFRRFVNGEGGILERAKMVCHCLLIETNDGLVLVDSGLGSADIARPRRNLGSWFLAVVNPMLDREETAMRQVARLGFSPRDVRHIILTHLDLDHAGGISDFPHAKVHVLDLEYLAAMNPLPKERLRYRPMHFSHRPDFVRHTASGEPWFGFSCVRQLPGLPPEILMIPLLGHSRGHAAVAVETREGWLVHAGDAYFFHGEMDSDRRRCPPGLELFQTMAQADGQQRRHNQERLRKLANEHRGEVRVFCAHDPVEFAAFQREQGTRLSEEERESAVQG